MNKVTVAEILRHAFIVVGIAVLLNFHNKWNLVIYLIVLISIIVPLHTDLKNVWKNCFLWFLAIFSGSSYLLLLSAISNIEFWGDEIGVIEIAIAPFSQIVNSVSRLHAAVPPLDYWNLHLWIKFTPYLSNALSPEVYYRIPYMIIHSMAAILFAYILISVAKGDKTIGLNRMSYLISFIAFIVYFFHPILFVYSIEVRFYALLSLGVVFTLFLWQKKRLADLKYFPLQMLFCLNSVLHFIVLLPFVAIGLFNDGKKTKKYLILFVELAIVLFLIYPKLLIPESVSFWESWKLIKSALSMFYSTQIVHWVQLLSLIAMFSVGFMFTKVKKGTILLLLISAFYAIATIFLAFTKGYFDFYFRHLIHLVPLYLLALLLIPMRINRYSHKLIFVVLLVFTLVVPSLLQIKANIIDQKLFSKSLIGAKEVYRLARARNFSIIVMPNIPNTLPLSVYDFYHWTFRWYKKYYQDVIVYNPITSEEACSLFLAYKKSILYSFSSQVNCPEVRLNHSCVHASCIITHVYE